MTSIHDGDLPASADPMAEYLTYLVVCDISVERAAKNLRVRVIFLTR
jgi:hypothetical protein